MGVQTHFDCLFLINIELLVFIFFLIAIEPESNRQFQSPWGVVVAAVVVEAVLVLRTVAAVVGCLLVVLGFGAVLGLADAGRVAGGSVVVVAQQTASLVVGIAKLVFVEECSVEKM